jgi:hypothetical protein
MAAAQRSGGPPRGWLARNEKFVRAICLMALYVSAAVFLVAVLAVGGMSIVSGILLGIFVASLCTILLLRRPKPRRS